MVQPEIIQFIRALPEASFLVSSSGEIIAANDEAVELTGKKCCELSSTRFVSLIKDSESKAADYLRLCARSRQLVPGAFRWALNDNDWLEIRCDAAVIVPRMNRRR